MKLAEDPGAQLFLDAYPVFLRSLPAAPELSSKWSSFSASKPNDHVILSVSDLLQLTALNAMLLLRSEIQTVQLVFHKTHLRYDLPAPEFHKAVEAVHSINAYLESLIDDEISPTGNQNVEHAEFRKLRAIATSGSKLFDYQDYISYDRVEHSVARDTVRYFNDQMRAIFSNAGLEDDIHGSSGMDEQSSMSDNGVNDEIDRAQKFCNSTKSLSRWMETQLKNCSCQHRAHVHLTGFQKPELDMVLSVCGAHIRWQRCLFVSSTGTDSLSRSDINDICSEMKKALRYKTDLRIDFDSRGWWKSASEPDRFQKSATPPDETLDKLLEILAVPGMDSPPPEKRRILERRDRLELAVLIAKSLLYLHGSPFLQRAWRAESVYVVISDEPAEKPSRTPKAFVPWKSIQTDDELEQNEIADPVPGDAFILGLGVLLWNLQTRQKITVTDEDEEEDDDGCVRPSLFYALNRTFIESERELDASYRSIIKSCLDLYCADDLSSSGGDRAFRHALYTNIVEPLTNYLESCFPGSVPKNGIEKKKSKTKLAKGHSSKAEGPMRRRPVVPIFQKSLVEERIIPKLPRQADEALKRNVLPQLAEVDASVSMPVSPDHVDAPALLASDGLIRSAGDWLDNVDKINQDLEDIIHDSPDSKRIKIAILDTGCDADAQYFAADPDGLERLEGHWQDFVGRSETSVDEDPRQHGTNLTTLLLRVARHAEVYVARVATNADKLVHAGATISKAILHAAQEWDVDIITMSFGFGIEVASIRDAIAEAERLKGQQLLVFAAANNNGANANELFPANLSSVISVRATSYDGAFVPMYDPQAWPNKAREAHFGTLGLNVPCDWVFGEQIRSGCSLAAPIMAATAAMVEQYVACSSEKFRGNFQRLVRTRAGMLQIFADVALKRGPNLERFYLAPWHFFDRLDEDRLATVQHALGRLPPSE